MRYALLIYNLITTMFASLTSDEFKIAADGIIDVFEDKFPDNATVQRCCEMARKWGNIPDLPDATMPMMMVECPDDKDCPCDE